MRLVMLVAGVACLLAAWRWGETAGRGGPMPKPWRHGVSFYLAHHR
jgi:hypothetical protein